MRRFFFRLEMNMNFIAIPSRSESNEPFFRRKCMLKILQVKLESITPSALIDGLSLHRGLNTSRFVLCAINPDFEFPSLERCQNCSTASLVRLEVGPYSWELGVQLSPFHAPLSPIYGSSLLLQEVMVRLGGGGGIRVRQSWRNTISA